MTYPTTKLILVRHGETTANAAGRVQGRTNDPLTKRGHQQVEAVARRLAEQRDEIEAIYSSSLLRAQLTATAIGAALDLPVRLRDALQEMHLGDLENIGAAELAGSVPHDPDDRYPNGESPREFVERIMGALYGIMAAHPGGTVVVVSHGGVISTAFSVWQHGYGNQWQRYVPDNCSVSIIEFHTSPTVTAVNNCAHLI